MQESVVLGREDDDSDLAGQVSQVGGFSDRTLSFEGFSSATSSSPSIGDGGESEDTEKLIDRSINATIVLLEHLQSPSCLLLIRMVGPFLKCYNMHNWSAYEEAVKTNPVLAKMMISGDVE